MTTDMALGIAQNHCPLDLVGRLIYITQRCDSERDEETRRAWEEAWTITRNGIAWTKHHAA